MNNPLIVNYNIETIYTLLQKIFKDVDLENKNEAGYVGVHCPFHVDTKQSAFINPVDGFFKCFGPCNTQYQFEDLLKTYFKLTDLRQLTKLTNAIINNAEDNELTKRHTSLLNNPIKITQLLNLGISQQVINDIPLVDSYNYYELCIPILLNGILIGYKYYTKIPPTINSPKSIVSPGVANGLIIPFDNWQRDLGTTLVCEGEKDMLIARSLGFNAITLTGGAGALPIGWETYFINRAVIICYDNDEAGITGATKLANHLFKNGANNIRVMSNWFEVIKEEKEDLADFFMKYKKQPEDFINYAKDTPLWTKDDGIKLKLKEIPLITLDNSILPTHLTQRRQSLVQVKAEVSTPQSIPLYIKLVWKPDADHNESYSNFEYDYMLTSDEMQNILSIFASPGGQRKQMVKSLAHNVAFKKGLFDSIKSIGGSFYYSEFSLEQQPLFSSIVSPYLESEISAHKMTNEKINETLELVGYSLERLETSKIYTITYRTIPKTELDRVTVVAIEEIDQAVNSVSNFKVTDTTKVILESFKPLGLLSDKVVESYNRIKYNGIAHLDYNLWLANELTFHSCLQFRLNNKPTRGTIYTNIIGDTRVGKSEISQHLVQLYGQGKFINAKLATVDSLIGGTDKVNGENFIKAGVLPKNDKGLIILEELHGLGDEYYKKVTEVKSSGKVSLQRVSGELSLSCNLRLIEISNPTSSKDGGMRTVGSFTNGISLIKSQISAPEDIARNDLYIVVQRSAAISPYAHAMYVEKLPSEYYTERIKWAWSRTMDNISFEDEENLWESCKNELAIFDCEGISILGTESYIKVAKMAVSLAMLTASTIDYENIIVKREHVQFIISWLKDLYSNDTMRVDEYVRDENLYSEENEGDIAILEDIYLEWSSAIDHLESSNETSKDLLSSLSGKAPNAVGPLFTALNQNRLIKIEGTYNKIIPSLKFRKIIKKINKFKTNITTHTGEY